MEVDLFVGLPVEIVEIQLEKMNTDYKIVESSDIQKKHDIVLVVRATEKDNYVELVTDKFLLNI